MNRSVLEHLLHSAAGSRLMTVLERIESQRPNLLRVLTYHRVDDREAFDQHMEYLAARYNVVSMPELLNVYEGGRMLPRRSVMITFDDAYCDFEERAWPVLKHYRLPVTLFVATGFPDQRHQIFWWDQLAHDFRCTRRRDELHTPVGRLPLQTARQREEAFVRLRQHLKTLRHAEMLECTREISRELRAAPLETSVLGWDALRRLAREGVTLGAHTRTHPFLNRVSAEEAHREVVGSMEDLRREIGTVLPIFAYPDGRHSEAAVEVVKNAGVRLAFTTRRGTNDLRHADPLALRRINISRGAKLPVLRARLIHSSVYVNRWRRLFDPQPALNGGPGVPTARRRERTQIRRTPPR